MEGLELGRLLGAGGFADVYEAVEPQLGRRVAVKIFRTRVDGADRKSFEREAQVTGRMSGVRNIVHVYRSGFTDDDHPFLVMERMEYSMAALVGNDNLTIDHVMHTGVVIGEALRVAHEEGILHRDLKPENILVDRYGEPAISDFGISSIMEADGSSSIYGFTAEHAAPELFEEARATPATDVYSLGATLFTLAEARPPFAREPGEGPLSFMTRVKNSPCPPCSAVIDSHPELDELLRSALEKNPEDRPDLDAFISSVRAMSVARTENGDVSAAGGGDTGRLPTVAAIEGDDADGSDTVIGRGASRSRSASDGAGETTDNDSHHDSGGHEPAGGKAGTRKRILVGVTSVAIVVAVGATLGFRSIRDNDADTAVSSEDPIEATSTTSESDSANTTEPPGDLPDGVEDSEPLGEPGVRDTSGLLRSRIDEFAATTGAPSVRNAVFTMPQDANDLGFGDPPVRADYGALNRLYTPSCYRVVLNDIAVLGAAALIWSDASEFTFVNAAQFQTEEAARQYFWAASLFVGVDKDSCEGWPADGVAIDPEGLTIDRKDFAMDTDADDFITAIDDDLKIDDFTANLAYESVARMGTVVIVATSGRLTESGKPGPFVRTLEEALAAFSSP